VLAVVGIVLVVLPQLARSRAKSGKINCVNNLKQVGLAFRIWPPGASDTYPTQVSVTNGGAREFAEQGSAYGIFLSMTNELSTPKILFCPAESSPRRQMATAFTGPTTQGVVPLNDSNAISYFVGIDAHDTAPQTILSGDDHFNIGTVTPGRGLLLLATNASVEWRNERHGKQGYIGFADGSVQGFTTPGFRAALLQTGIATNRLAMP
jgi:prepilin-type processing-associated H-X9-DG protein